MGFRDQVEQFAQERWGYSPTVTASFDEEDVDTIRKMGGFQFWVLRQYLDEILNKVENILKKVAP